MVVIYCKDVAKFIWKQIVCRFGLPHMIINDNGKQFGENPIKNQCTEKGIKLNFTLEAYPQMNTQVEVTNKTLFKGINK